MEKIKKDGIRLAGLKLDGKTTNRDNQSGIDCGNLWQRFESEKIPELIPHKLSDETYAVYYEYEKDETAPFSYFIGCMIDEKTPLPAGLSELNIPAQNYFKVPVKGVMTDCLIDAWQKIWVSGIKRDFSFDFEIYDERSKDWSNAELDIYISTS